jgi:hypothetical protein
MASDEVIFHHKSLGTVDPHYQADLRQKCQNLDSYLPLRCYLLQLPVYLWIGQGRLLLVPRPPRKECFQHLQHNYRLHQEHMDDQ